MRNKVLQYVINCWYDSRCHKKEDILQIIDEVINENPDLDDFIELGVIAKRRCIGEL